MIFSLVERVFGVFFSADTQVRDWLSPKRTIVSPGSNPNFDCTFDEFPIFSQDIPMYLWDIVDNSKGQSIFGSQTNEWWTTNVPVQPGNPNPGQFNHVRYQSIDRIDDSAPPFGSRMMIPNQADNESYYMGFIHNTYNNATDAAYDSSNPTVGVPSQFNRGPSDDLVNNTAPFYFYFGLVKGASAFDRFLTKWVGGDENIF